MSTGLEKPLTVDSWNRVIPGIAAMIWLARPLLRYTCRAAFAKLKVELKNGRTR